MCAREKHILFIFTLNMGRNVERTTILTNPQRVATVRRTRDWYLYCTVALSPLRPPVNNHSKLWQVSNQRMRQQAQQHGAKQVNKHNCEQAGSV